MRSITEGSVGRQWGLSLGDGSGNLFSGGEDFGNHGVSSSASEWPWYVPTVKKVSCGEMSRFLTGEEVVAAEQWLNTPETFHRLLRGIPTNRRARFKMVWPHERLRLLIDAGILEKAGDEKTFSWVKIFAVPEAEKKRCRLIIEPRSINEAYKRNDVSLPLVLPTLHDVENIVSQSSTITSIDFRSFFYQILLGGSVRQFFRAYINNEVYNVCVLPQGACFSPFIAQMFAKAVTRHMFPRKHFIVYIDNIYVSNSYEDPACPCIFDIGSEKRGPEGTILGLRFDCNQKTIAIGRRLKEKLRSHSWRNIITFGCVFKVTGRILFAARVLHKAMCEFRSAMVVFSEVCHLFSLVSPDYDTDIALDTDIATRVRLGMSRLLTAAKEWEAYEITADRECNHYTFTDASNDQGAFVITEGKNAWVTSWSFKEETRSHESINVKELKAIRKAVTAANGGVVHIITDSLVSIREQV